MNPTTIGGMISIDSHTKQIKLLNDYILSLEKKVGEKKDQFVNKQSLAEEVRKMNEENNRLRNQNAQLKYNLYKHEENAKKMSHLELEKAGLKAQFEKQISEKNQILSQNQLLSQQLQKCEAHLQAAQRQIQSRTQIFERDAKLFTNDIQQLKGQLIKLSNQFNKIREERNFFQAKFKEAEASLQETIRSKNQAVLKFSQAHQEIKSKLNEQLIQSNNKNESYSGQLRDLTKQLNDSRAQVASSKKEVYDLRSLLQKKNDQLAGIIARLNAKTQEYENSIRSNNQQKTNLIRIIRRLEDEKKTLQSLNNSVKGDVNEQTKLRAEMVKRNEILSLELTQTSKQLSEVKNQLQSISFLKQQVELKVESLNQDFNTMKQLRDQTQNKRREMEQTNQVLLKDFFNQKNYFEFCIKSNQETIEKKNKQVAQLEEKVIQLQAQLLTLRDNSNTSSKQFFAFKNAKESQIASLNVKIKQSIKEQTILRQALDAVRQEYQFYQKRKEGEIQELNIRLKDLQKQHLGLKDSNDLLTREYYTFQKKNEADNYNFNQRIKDLTKKLQKKDAKIDQLNQQIKEVQKISQYSRKNLDASQKEQMQRIKAKFQKEKNELILVLNEQKYKNDQLSAEKQTNLKNIEQLQNQIRNLRDQFKTKQRSLGDANRDLQKEKDSLLQQVKNLNLSVTITSQARSTREIQIQAMKRSILHLEGYSAEQKKNIDSLNKLLAQKQKQIESLEHSNTTLRKQVIASLNNEQASRKEALEVRSRAGSGIATSRVRGATSRKTTYSQFPPKQNVKFVESMVGSGGDLRISGHIQRKISNSGTLKDLLIDEASLLSSLEAKDNYSVQTRQI